MSYIKNDLSNMIQQNLQGICRVYSHLSMIEQTGIVYLSDTDNHTIPIISGGGSGHEPAHTGYVGKGMLSASISGKIFTPPTSDEILKAIRFVNKGNGVFIIIKNFEADIREFSLAIEQAKKDGIPIKYIISIDDISVETSNFQVRHRGVAGTLFLHKVLGAAAQKGATLDELEALALSISPNIATLGVATRPATIPGEKYPMFSLDENQISFGIGIHGESGYKTNKFQSSELLANELVNKLKMHFKWKEGEHYALMINNLGSTTEMEEMIFSNDLIQLLNLEGIKIDFIKVGKFITSLDMTGLSITLFKLNDSKLVELLHAPTTAYAW